MCGEKANGSWFADGKRNKQEEEAEWEGWDRSHEIRYVKVLCKAMYTIINLNLGVTVNIFSSLLSISCPLACFAHLTSYASLKSILLYLHQHSPNQATIISHLNHYGSLLLVLSLPLLSPLNNFPYFSQCSI